MERREFIRKSCSLCLLVGSGIIAETLESCSTVPFYSAAIRDRRVTVPRSLLTNTPVLIVEPEEYEFNIAVEQCANGDYHALLLRCTHAANPLAFDGTQFTCSLHGSKFNEQGGVVRGPASHPLQELTVHATETELSIGLPEALQ